MARIHLKFRAVDRAGFNYIRTGLKKVETRAATSKYQGIQAGDTLVISCDGDSFERMVKSVRRFKSIQEMLTEISLKDIMPDIESAKEARKIYENYPGYREKIKECGIIAFGL